MRIFHRRSSPFRQTVPAATPAARTSPGTPRGRLPYGTIRNLLNLRELASPSPRSQSSMRGHERTRLSKYSQFPTPGNPGNPPPKSGCGTRKPGRLRRGEPRTQDRGVSPRHDSVPAGLGMRLTLAPATAGSYPEYAASSGKRRVRPGCSAQLKVLDRREPDARVQRGRERPRSIVEGAVEKKSHCAERNGIFSV